MGEYYDMEEEGIIGSSGEYVGTCANYSGRRYGDIQCEICKKYFPPEGMTQHIVAKHPEAPLPDSIEKCEVCGNPIPKEKMQKHLRRKHKQSQ